VNAENKAQFTIHKDEKLKRTIKLISVGGVFSCVIIVAAFHFLGYRILPIALYVSISVIGFILLPIIVEKHKVEVNGTSIQKKSLFSKKTFGLHEISYAIQIENQTRFYSEKDKLLFSISKGEVNYELFMELIAERNIEVENGELSLIEAAIEKGGSCLAIAIAGVIFYFVLNMSM